MKEIALVIMAAGIGSRFGGLKQLEPIGPNGETLLDFTIYDACKAGFHKIVLIVRKETEALFRESVGGRAAKKVAVEYVFQTVDDLPDGRTKPWGTGHAILCCKQAVSGPFAVINADDYYGPNSLAMLYKHLCAAQDGEFAMVAFPLGNTLSENGTVARGVCRVENGLLRDITERTKIQDFRYTEDDTTWHDLPQDTLVSMNLWGFTPLLFQALETEFAAFLQRDDLDKAEFFLPSVVSSMIQRGDATVTVLRTDDQWYGITYREDKQTVAEAFAKRLQEGQYHGL